jgi:HNH endonuclease
MTKEEIIKAIQACAKKLGRSPNLRDLRKMAGINESELYRKLGNLKKALLAAGLKVRGSGFYSGRSELLLDWAAVVRKLGKLPATPAYEREGNFSAQPFFDRFGSWKKMGETFRKFTAEESIQRQWKDVLEIIAKHEERLRWVGKGRSRRKCPLKLDRPVYGPPLLLPGMAHAPTNEAGVLFAFGVLAARLGFVVKRWQTEFPDCLAVREMARGQWQDQNVEVEMYSRNFARHKHDAKRCDVIVCWEHNWPECPEWIEVVELKKVVEEMGNRGPTEVGP